MTTFDKREKGFEEKYKHDQELQFKVEVRRNMLLGLWVAEMLGKAEDEAQTYAKEVVAADFEEPGDDDIVRKILADFEEAGTEFSEHRLRKKMDEFLEIATEQLMEE